jgi:hypothetical protein
MPIVYLFLMMGLLLPLADVAIAGFQFLSAWQALRDFGQYVQYHAPADPTNTTGWQSGLTTTSVSGYTISNLLVSCGDATPPVACTNATLIPKYFSYTTSVTVAPMVLGHVFCGSSATTCSFKLPYSERFQ